MKITTISQALFVGLLTSAPLVVGEPSIGDVGRRFIGSPAAIARNVVRAVGISDLDARHHTEAQIAAKNAAKAKAKANKGGKRDAATPPPDEFGPWDSDTDEFGSWVDKREAHHTEAQIAAKNAAKAKAKAGKGGKRDAATPPPDEFGPWDSDADEFGSWVDKREAHHTEAQIAAKNAAKAKADKGGKRDAATPPPDEFGPWDSDTDEFGSWVDKREAHHTEAQIAAKNAAKAKAHKGGKREAHHTEAQIAAKNAAKAKAHKGDKREAHHTEAQIAAKNAAKHGAKNNN